MIDSTLYTGWSDGTLKARTYNGTTFGPAANVNLYGLTDFGNEIPNITGVFYDKSAGRLYYSLSGQSQLYYRYFTPQSQIIGAVRFNGPANGTASTSAARQGCSSPAATSTSDPASPVTSTRSSGATGPSPGRRPI